MAYANSEKRKAARATYYAANKEMILAYSRKHYELNKERILAHQAQYRVVHKEKIITRDTSHKRLKHSGVSQTQYDGAYLAQKGVCAICSGVNKSDKALHADHCHTSGIFRGLLCAPCNLRFERFKVDHPLAEKAFDYMLAAELRQQA